MAGERQAAGAGRGRWLYDDLLAWLCPGGLLLTALVLRFPAPLHALRALAPELVLPSWLAAAYALGLALSPLGRLAYAAAQAVVWPWLRQPWAPALQSLAAPLAAEGRPLPPVSAIGVGLFHDLDRRLREWVEAHDAAAAAVLDRMKVLCSLACNTLAACVVFGVVDLLAGNAAYWTAAQVSGYAGCCALAAASAVYRERRRQRTQLSVWRRLQLRAQGVPSA